MPPRRACCIAAEVRRAAEMVDARGGIWVRHDRSGTVTYDPIMMAT